jgi:ATP-dependent exoDNAse (exonuclease V) beta subunit
MLGQPTLQALLAMPSEQSKGIQVVRNEQPFAVKVPAGTNFAHRTIRLENQLSGIIDRLVVRCEGNKIVAGHIIDYKTDFIDDKNAKAADILVHRYAPQLAGYRFAASRLLGLDVNAIDTSLMLLHRDLHVPVDVDRFAAES